MRKVLKPDCLSIEQSIGIRINDLINLLYKCIDFDTFAQEVFNIYAMATLREITYMVNDELKLDSNDSFYTIEHFKFLADKFRALLLERKYRDLRRGEVPHANYQTLCLDLMEVPGLPGSDCSEVYLRSTVKIPSVMPIGIRRVYPVDYFESSHITWVSKERMQFVGHNEWLRNIIYVTKGPDDYLYLKSDNPQFLYLRQLKFDGVFFNFEKAQKLSCDSNEACDILDTEFPLEEGLVGPLVQMLVEEFSAARYAPQDNKNNAADDLSGISMK